MTESLKSNWKKVGKDFAALGKDLGTSLAKSVRKGVNVATDWAQEKPKEEQPIVEEQPEEPKAE
ncbi:MAG: hypothetical protein IJP98_03340 [Clostridia bacterium]|nr:hypothetical protein [Clostridia bacterium]